MLHLDRLRDMGVDILWLMPIYPVGIKNRKGSLGSYYSVSDYQTVNPEFGTLEDLRTLVSRAHEYGMKVMLDWVANHTSWDHVWTLTNPEFYKKNNNGDFFSPYDWSDVIELDYDNIDLRKAMIEVLKFWVTETDIDGYRCDVAGLVPTDFWEEARQALNEVKQLFMLAEDSDKPELLRYAFDMNYNSKVHNLFNRIACGESPAHEFWAHYSWNDSIFDSKAFRMNFITNHDENSWNGSEFERLDGGVEAFAALIFFIPGMPLIYSGQEAGLEKRLRFFEKDMIEWGSFRLHNFYKMLIKIKKDYSPLLNGHHGASMERIETNYPDEVLAFSRSDENCCVTAVFNLSRNKLYAVKIDLAGRVGFFENILSSESHNFKDVYSTDMEPWEYLLLLTHCQSDY